jgi:F0F1-type ATP synthase delta subunit
VVTRRQTQKFFLVKIREQNSVLVLVGSQRFSSIRLIVEGEVLCVPNQHKLEEVHVLLAKPLVAESKNRLRLCSGTLCTKSA